MTFAGLAKPHCNVCLSRYHAEDVCPSADLDRKSRLPQTVCFEFNKSSGCRRRNCSYPTCAAAAIPVPTPLRNASSCSPAAPTRPQDPATVARSKVEQQLHNHKPVVSSPIDIYRLELELATHPDIICLVRSRRVLTLNIQGRVQYRVSPKLISAAQHPDVVFWICKRK